MVDKECQVLKYLHQWVETIDLSVAVMQAMFQSTKERSTKFFQTLAANFTELSKKQQDINEEYRPSHEDHYGNNNNNNKLKDYKKCGKRFNVAFRYRLLVLY